MMASKGVTRLLSPILCRKSVGDPTLQAKQVAISFIQKRKYYEKHYEGIVEADPTVRGIELLRDPGLNKVDNMVFSCNGQWERGRDLGTGI